MAAPTVDPDEIERANQLSKVETYTPNADMAEMLARMGVKQEAYVIPQVDLFVKMEWEKLCTIPTRMPKTLVSPVMIVVRVDARPEEKGDFKDYVGFVYCEAVTEDLEQVSFTTSYAYAESGEMLPLTDYLMHHVPPFPLRIGYVETRKTDHHVVKPFPIIL